LELGEGEVEGVEVVVAAGKLEGEGVVGEGAFEAAAEDAAFEEEAAFDGETGLRVARSQRWMGSSSSRISKSQD